MKHITFYLDFISPYAHLAFEALPEALMGVSYRVSHVPVLFAGLLKHHGQLGPAEIASKREWTYRQVLWLAHSRGIALDMPASHPFNPLALLRLALACSAEATPGAPNRYVCETIFRHVWRGGAEAVDAQRQEALTRQLRPGNDPESDAVKVQLKKNTDAAIARGVFGVPTFAVDDKLFWGLDALVMLRNYLLGDPWFDGPDWNSVHTVSSGIARRHQGL
ncbi:MULTISPECIES: 2-hydroxychromene-2-carboxylate isomerase [unclassified Polaromonas]|jgi:2-hydroxychromene-2-carboxylate isomerase|uniref:2-hydroxychromene-2-carboxylate isomerase n=1 Tax=unclassified Polaromonas TaxID=2638319 RepID=UPI0018C97B09|nr:MULTISPECIES: 2-hydroxychromene-2-carboxylate isomerase [unclassified Polaromonas]MBG6072906.1 2-hydroxychromene-2-carboxylate isomerase [Polaromonas sp. CG_9.7]MBG6114944.1 2-hydroxychromene-2-carboxylate isomerase [Polaromonas sp. CG_9.2]MDH6183666.1 2-hydroxychromene-2-carboxylate isomerase [Polaromonas sp. CG_23.6]